MVNPLENKGNFKRLNNQFISYQTLKKQTPKGSLEAMKRKWAVLNPVTPIDGEEWKTISEFPLYQISNHGRIKNCQMENLLKGRSLNGYTQVCIKSNSRLNFRYVHILVLTYFRCPCPPGLESRHLDGIRNHNYLDNLVWGTHQENIEDKVKHRKERELIDKLSG